MPEVSVKLTTEGFEQASQKANKLIADAHRLSNTFVNVGGELKSTSRELGRFTGHIANIAGANIQGPLSTVASSIGLIGTGMGVWAGGAIAIGGAVGLIVNHFQNVKKEQEEILKLNKDIENKTWDIAIAQAKIREITGESGKTVLNVTEDQLKKQEAIIDSLEKRGIPTTISWAKIWRNVFDFTGGTRALTENTSTIVKDIVKSKKQEAELTSALLTKEQMRLSVVQQRRDKEKENQDELNKQKKILEEQYELMKKFPDLERARLLPFQNRIGLNIPLPPQGGRTADTGINLPITSPITPSKGETRTASQEFAQDFKDAFNSIDKEFKIVWERMFSESRSVADKIAEYFFQTMVTKGINKVANALTDEKTWKSVLVWFSRTS